jgi:DNA-binding response OmpR family regulator
MNEIKAGRDKALVLTVDDEAKITELLAAYLEAAGYAVVTAKNGRAALAVIEAARPDLVLLDLMLPDISGEIVCRKAREIFAREKSASPPIIMLTAKVDEESIIGGLTMGADDYITKPFSPKQVVARVQAALRRSGAVQNSVQGGDGAGVPAVAHAGVRCGELELDGAAQLVTKAGVILPLTAEEYKLLELFMTSGARVFTRDEIISRTKGDEFYGFDRTIDAHIKNLRKKIGDDPKNARYIQTVYGIGYRFVGEGA